MCEKAYHTRWARPHAVVLQGFVTKDRRAAHVREADDQLAESLQREAAAAAAATESEGEDEGGPAGYTAAAATGSGILLENLLRDDRQFDLLVRTLRVLVQMGQPAEAQQLTQHILHMLSPRSITDK